MNLQSVKQRFGIIGTTPALDHALLTAIRVAPTDLTVLITGESGVGKEAFSRIIHELSPRKHQQLIAINCGAIPEGTINSELFGHEKGAFTGANDARKGYFETVDGGTIFLDEVGEMPLETQTRLLRVLEQGEFIRVGSSKVLKTNVRVVAATNVDMREKIAKGKFREDLYYRLATVPITVPALRERPDDIYLLFRRFASDYAERYRSEQVQLDAEARQLLEQYRFPGNVRELKNIAERVSLLASHRLVDANELLRLVPGIAERHLPVYPNSSDAAQATAGSDRELIFKFLFDMKQDIGDLKNLLFQLVHDNNLKMPAVGSTMILPTSPPATNHGSTLAPINRDTTVYHAGTPAVVIETASPAATRHAGVEEGDQHLSLDDMERDMIVRALRKHRNRRRDAAIDLGISERTLYRKIKQYDIVAE